MRDRSHICFMLVSLIMRYWCLGFIGAVSDVVSGTTNSRYNGNGNSRVFVTRNGQDHGSRWQDRYTSAFEAAAPGTREALDGAEWATSRTYMIPVGVLDNSNNRATESAESHRRQTSRPHSILRRSKSAHSVRRSVYFEDELDTYISTAVDEEILADRKLIDRIVEDIIVRRRAFYETLYKDMKDQETTTVRRRVENERDKLQFHLEKLLVTPQAHVQQSPMSTEERVHAVPSRRSRIDNVEFRPPLTSTYQYRHEEESSHVNERFVDIPTQRPTGWNRYSGGTVNRYVLFPTQFPRDSKTTTTQPAMTKDEDNNMSSASSTEEDQADTME